MPPRYVYWTIIVDGQPTAFRSGSLEDIMPTFNRLKEKQPTAELKWFQHGKLWSSRHDAQDFMRARGDRGRERDPRQGRDQGSGIGDQGADRPERAWNAKPDWKTRSSFSPRKDAGSGFGRADKPRGDKPAWVPKGPGPKPETAGHDEKPEWKPKGTFKPSDDEPRATRSKPSSFARSTGEKPEWRPKGTFKPKEAGHSSGWEEKRSFSKPEGKPAWKPKGDTGGKPEWKAAGKAAEGRPAWKPKGDAGGKPEWKPKGTFRPKEEGHRPSTFGKPPAHKSARDEARSSFRPKSYTPRDEGAGPTRSAKARDQKLEWKPSSGRPAARPSAERRSDGPNAGFAKTDPDAPKRKWVPKAEYKKSLGIEAKRDDKWRPGGEHKDPKQKYKDAKKAKWSRFKEAIRSRSAKPRKPKGE